MSRAAERRGEARRIELLPDALADQIAAGEVVERPASVVKELCENAIDAGATRLDVEIAGGGVLAIVVSDDGRGMDPRDLGLCVLRHATSKLRSIEELSRMGTFGFRGEALASIASVSRVRITSRTREASSGHVLELEGGGPAALRPCGAPPGTRVEVRELFYNVPARRKFLKALATESAHVGDAVEAVALASPGVSVTLSRDGRRARELLRAPSREVRVADLLATETLLEARGERGPLRIEAWLSRPERARSGAGSLRIVVNDRLVRDRTLARAVAQAYGSKLDPGRYPVGVVYVDLPPELVDVNVHPQKSEVRFTEPRAVRDALYRVVEASLRDAASSTGGVRRAATPPREPASTERASRPSAVWNGSGSTSAPRSTAVTGGVDEARSRELAARLGLPPPPAASTPDPDAGAAYPLREPHTAVANAPDLPRSFAELRFVAQLGARYLLVESEDAYAVLDQHAASERVLFDALRLERSRGAVERRSLVVPTLVDADPRLLAALEAELPGLAALGLDLRPAGRAQIAVHALPAAAAERTDLAALIEALLSRLDRARGNPEADEAGLVATIACAGALPSGERIAQDEGRRIAEALSGAPTRLREPVHRRLVLSWSTVRELEQRAGRR